MTLRRFRSESARDVALGAIALLMCLGPWSTTFAASITYIKNGNVWISTPDGTTQRPVTTDGTPEAPYYSPTQADDGTIVVGWGSRLYRVNQTGNLVGPPIPTLVSEKPANVHAVGPFNPRVSPDGTVVAYWIGLSSGSYDPGCDCYLTSSVESVVYARTDGGGPIGFSRFWQTPSWIGNTGVLLFAPNNRQTPQVGVGTLGSLGNEQGWFNDDGTGFDGYWQNVDDGELDRSGRKLVLVRGMQAERLSLYAVGDFATPPLLACEGAGPAGAFTGPAWAPDGRALAWYENDGVWVSPAPADLTTPGACGELDPHLLIPGASQPRWGVANMAPVNPTATTPRPASTPTPTRTPPSGATATAVPACPGDCNADRVVTVDELVRGVTIAIGNQPVTACSAFDVNRSGSVTIEEIVRAVNVALNTCAG